MNFGYHIVLVLLVSLFCSILGHSQSGIRRNANKANTYALVVGIASYQNRSIPPLRFAENDARLFAEYLQSPAGGAIPASNLRILLGKEATISGIYEALRWLKAKSKKGDKVFFYFSGHGDVETEFIESQGYLLAWNTPPNNYRNNAIKVQDVNDWANDISTRNRAEVVIIADACHSGKLAGDFLNGKVLTQQHLLTVLNNEVRITACGPDELAAEGTEWGGGRGVFSYYLLLGLNGLASSQQPGRVPLESLQKFVDSSFKADEILKLQQHRQSPVLDGHPAFTMAAGDPQAMIAFQRAFSNRPTVKLLPEGLIPFTKPKLSPMMYFFSILKDYPIESILEFEKYLAEKPLKLPRVLIEDYLAKINEIEERNQRISFDEMDSWQQPYAAPDSLSMLLNQINSDKNAVIRFNRQFVMTVQARAQEMINAYLAGDVNELERRQYYFSGKRSYDDFIPMLQLALKLVEKDHYLAPILQIDYHYLSGLHERLKMPFLSSIDSAITVALSYQRKALALEPYAAYIHNELGNLLLLKEAFDSAAIHYALAKELAPVWAIPSANLARLHLAIGNYDLAVAAMATADSLQQDLPFLQANMGLISEKKNDLLAAQMHYYQSIKNNNVHFFPYERLGHIMIKTGEFLSADRMLHDAAIRKDMFTVNSSFFRFGIVQGGLPPIEDAVEPSEPCGSEGFEGIIKTKYLQLLKGLGGIIGSSNDSIKAQQILLNLLKENPNIPFAYHYVGLSYFKAGNFVEAEKFIRLAIKNYKDWSQTHYEIYNDIFLIPASDQNDSCILPLLMQFHYPFIHDYYLLGNIYEHLKKYNLALEQYQIISSIERKNLFAQADFDGFDAFDKFINPGGIWPNEDIIKKYHQVVPMYGYLLAMRVCERMNDFEGAEKVLLGLVETTRAAGDRRQSAIDAGVPGANSAGSTINFYWLRANRDVEIVAYDFYQRMMTLFPRNPEWFKKGALFLHDRLWPAYKQMAPEIYPYVTESISDYAYPWEEGVKAPYPDIVRFEIPVSGVLVEIFSPVYNPVQVAMQWMNEYLKLGRVRNPDERVIAALAHFNSWIGESQKAVRYYKDWIKMTPLNKEVRYEASDYMNAQQFLVPAFHQYDTLYQRGQLDNAELLRLSYFYMLTGNFNLAHTVLNKFTPSNDNERVESFLLKAQIFTMQASIDSALFILENNIPPLKIDDFFSFYDYNQLRFIHYYTIARLYAIKGEEVSAIMYLKLSVEAGFNLVYVLKNDEAWSLFRDKEPWQQIIETISAPKEYPSFSEGIYINPIEYRIPNFSSGH